MCRSFGPRIRNWCTFNEPGVYTFSGYFFGSFPPGKFFATRIAGLVVKHMLIAHERAYKLIKSLPGASAAPHVKRRIRGGPLHACCTCHLCRTTSCRND